MSEETKFESWAIVEVMGHRQFAGRVEEVTIAGAGMLRVDVPAVQGAQGFSKILSPSAIYAITPTDEETAMQVARRMRSRPLDVWVQSETRQAALPGTVIADHPDPWEDEDEGHEEGVPF